MTQNNRKRVAMCRTILSIRLREVMSRDSVIRGLIYLMTNLFVVIETKSIEVNNIIINIVIAIDSNGSRKINYNNLSYYCFGPTFIPQPYEHQ